MRLLAVELNRFRSRRTIVALALVALLAAVVLIGATAWQTRPLSGADRTDAAAQAELEGEKPERQAEVRACQKAPQAYLGPDATAADCAPALVSPPETYYPRAPLDLGSALPHRGIELALVVVCLMVVAGSTFAGADWASGSLTNQLLFEPRRLRLWLAKALAVTLGSGVVTAVALSGFWLGLAALHVTWHVVRTVALGMGAALGAFALTMVFRSTVATLALLLVYSVGGEIAVNVLPVEGAGRWSVGNNVLGWLVPHHRYFDASIDCVVGDRCSPMQVMTHLEAGVFLGILVVVSVLVSIVLFRRRDV
jgi:ABC-2 type transport system permease protein